MSSPVRLVRSGRYVYVALSVWLLIAAGVVNAARLLVREGNGGSAVVFVAFSVPFLAVAMVRSASVLAVGFRGRIWTSWLIDRSVRASEVDRVWVDEGFIGVTVGDERVRVIMAPSVAWFVPRFISGDLLALGAESLHRATVAMGGEPMHEPQEFLDLRDRSVPLAVSDRSY